MGLMNIFYVWIIVSNIFKLSNGLSKILHKRHCFSKWIHQSIDFQLISKENFQLLSCELKLAKSSKLHKEGFNFLDFYYSYFV